MIVKTNDDSKLLLFLLKFGGGLWRGGWLRVLLSTLPSLIVGAEGFASNF